jgi:hypothetical protein
MKMVLDGELQFSDAQAVTAAAGSTNTIDFGAARDMGVGEQLYVVVVVDEAFTDAGSDSTVVVAIEGDSTSTITPDYTRDLFTFAALSAVGTVKIAAMGPDDLQYRYARLKYTPANGNLSTGKFTAFLTKDIQKWKAYATNLVIS